MAMGGTDLNLLVALKVLLEEGNVTRAGERLGMTQPSMSGALAKLRRRFDDELLTRSGRDYELTPFARDLLPQVQETVHRLSQALKVENPFHPASSKRRFRVLMSDYAVSVLHEPLLTRIESQAPGVQLEIDPMPLKASEEHVLVEYDVMVGPMGYGSSGLSRPLWRDRMVCLVDETNPWLREGRLTLDDLREMPHAVTSLGTGILTPVERVLGELGVERRVQVQVTGWLPLPFLLEGTQMVAVVPERLARLHVGPGRTLVQVEPPFGTVRLVEGYWYASHRLQDPGHRWLFDRLDEVAELLSAQDPA